MLRQFLIFTAYGMVITVAACAPKTISTPQLIQEQIREYVRAEFKIHSKEEIDKTIQELRTELIDLNEDKTPELKVIGGSFLCGNRSCEAWYYRKVDTHYELLLTGAGDYLKVGENLTNGYHDLIYDQYLYQFNGKGYIQVR